MENLSLETVQNLVTLVAVLMLALVVLGTVGLTGLYVLLRQNGRVLEQLYLSANPDTRHWIRELVLAVKEGADLAVDLTDGDLTSPHDEERRAAGTLSARGNVGKE